MKESFKTSFESQIICTRGWMCGRVPICPYNVYYVYHVGSQGQENLEKRRRFSVLPSRERFLGGAKFCLKTALSVWQQPRLPWMNSNGGTRGKGDGKARWGRGTTKSRSLRRAHAQTAPCTRACSLCLQKDSQGFPNWKVVDVRICFVITHEYLLMLCYVGSAVAVASVRRETSVCVVWIVEDHRLALLGMKLLWLGLGFWGARERNAALLCCSVPPTLELASSDGSWRPYGLTSSTVLSSSYTWI